LIVYTTTMMLAPRPPPNLHCPPSECMLASSHCSTTLSSRCTSSCLSPSLRLPMGRQSIHTYKVSRPTMVFFFSRNEENTNKRKKMEPQRKNARIYNPRVESPKPRPVFLCMPVSWRLSSLPVPLRFVCLVFFNLGLNYTYRPWLGSTLCFVPSHWL